MSKKERILDLERTVIQLRTTDRRRVARIDALKLRVNRHNNRVEELERELEKVRACNKDQEITIQQLTEPICEEDPVWDNTDLHPDPCFTRQDIEKIVLNVMMRVVEES